MSRLGSIGGRLYRGEVSFDFVGRQRLWYAISGLIVLISIAAVVFRGLTFSVDFKGGSVFEFPASSSSSITQVRSTVGTAGGGGDAIVQHVTPLNGPAKWQVQTRPLTISHHRRVPPPAPGHPPVKRNPYAQSAVPSGAAPDSGYR